jgi:hypothetical protein
MSELDFPKNWTITTGKDRTRYGETIKLHDLTLPQVMEEIRLRGLVSYKIESEDE